MSFNRQEKGGIQSCRYCVPPKRHIGCHSTCEEYIRAKKEYDAEQDEIRKENRNQNAQFDVCRDRKRRYLEMTIWRKH